MSADVLREAAALMRSRAEAATDVWGVGRWRAVRAGDVYRDGMRTSDLDRHHVATDDEHGSILLTSPWDETQIVDQAASWHPLVALAVADWLEAEANVAERADANYPGRGFVDDVDPRALAVARTYLGGVR